MITNEDYLSYLSEIEIMERNMSDMYRVVVDDVSLPRVKKVFEALCKAEAKHGELVAELRQLVIGKLVKDS